MKKRPRPTRRWLTCLTACSLLAFGNPASAQLEEDGSIGFYANVNSTTAEPLGTVSPITPSFDWTSDDVAQARIFVTPPLITYPFNTSVELTGIGLNGFGVRAFQLRPHFSDGSRGSTVTQIGPSYSFSTNGDTHVRVITGKIYDFAQYDVVDVVAPDNDVDFQADNLGAPGSVPLSALQDAIAAKAPLGLAGVIDFEEATVGPNTFNGAMETLDAESNFALREIRARISEESILTIGINPDKTYVEAGGDNLATVDGPGPVLDSGAGWIIDGSFEPGASINFNPGGRSPTSGIAGLGSVTTYGFDFDAADKVVMAGLAYISRANFQHGNPDNIDKLWAKATYSDGSFSETLSSNKLQDIQGAFDHYFAFEAPDGLYITNIHVWCRGQNARAFTIVDDLAFVLEGPDTEVFDVTVASNNEARGTVTGGGQVADGGIASLTATPEEGFVFFGWRYADAPEGSFFSTMTEVDVPVYGPKNIVATFIEPGEVNIVNNTGNSPSIVIPLEDDVTTYDYIANDELQATIEVTNPAASYAEGGVVTLKGTGENGYYVRGWQVRNYFDDGSRSGNTTLIGDSLTVIVDGLTRVRPLISRVYDYAFFPVSDVIAPDNAVDYQADNLGAAGSIPLSVFNEALAAKTPNSLAGVVSFENPLIGPNTATGLEEEIPAETDVNIREIRAELTDFSFIPISINAEKTYVEAGGDNLATAAGPGPVRDTTQDWIINNRVEKPLTIDFFPSAGRTPTSGVATLGGTTSWAFDFNAGDKVVMAGLVYLSRANFQHGNPDNEEKIWAQATYSDGSTSDTLASSSLQDIGGVFDNFFGFEAPDGLYITTIHVWARGQNARAFTNIDDLAFVLEGPDTDVYDLSVVSNNEARGTVTGGGEVADGAAAALTATAEDGFVFLGWRYANAPEGAFFSSASDVNVPVYGPKNIVATFVEPGEVNIVNNTGNSPSLEIPLQDGVANYDYIVGDELQAIIEVTNAAASYPEGGIVTLKGTGENGYYVRGWQVRKYFDDGSRSGNTTLIGDSITVVVDGLTRVRPLISRVYDYAFFPVSDVIAPDNAVDFQADNLGAEGSIPLNVFNAILAEKTPDSLAGVVSFENPLIGPNTATGLEEEIPAETDVTIRQIRAEMADFSEVIISINHDKTYVEAGGDNLATAEGPGPIRDTGADWIINNRVESPVNIDFFPSAGRTPTSGISTLGGRTSWAFDFNAGDKVVMAGLVYLSRANFQHGNPDNEEKIWAQATYSDGSTSDTLASSNLQDIGGVYDNFFGFEAPDGLYITTIHVWARGQNARAFTNIDDLAFVLEGPETDAYEVTATSSDEIRGSVSGGGTFADGSVATLTATPEEGFVFFGWSYADAPAGAFFGSMSPMDFPVYGSKSLVATFVEPGEVNIVDNTGNSPGLAIPLVDGVANYDYIAGDELQATIEVTNAAASYPNGGVITLKGSGENGYFFRGWQVRSYFQDGSRSGNQTLIGDTIEVVVDGLTRVRPLLSRVYDYAYFPVSDVIAPDNAVDFEADNLGAEGSIPLSAFNAILAEKTPNSLAGVVSFEDPLIGPNTATGLEEEIPAETDVNIRQIRAELVDFSEVAISINPDKTYVEAGGDNLATAEGPGPVRDGGQDWIINNRVEKPLTVDFFPSAGRTPTSGVSTLGGATSWAFDFNAGDRVVMAGLVYLSRANFQHGNPENEEKIWAQATYSDGSTSATLASSSLQDVGGAYDNFFGFEAPDGVYITTIHVWARGQNARAFTNIDDLAIVLEGPETDLYEVTASASDDAGGTTSGSDTYADGSVATLGATPAEGFNFFGWYYAGSPYTLISGDSSYMTPVYGPKTLVAEFHPGDYGADPEMIEAVGIEEELMVWVFAQPDDEWTATADAEWVVLPEAPAVGTGWLPLIVLANAGSDRTATISIDGEAIFTIEQGSLIDALFPDAESLGGNAYRGSWLQTDFSVATVENDLFVYTEEHGIWFVSPTMGGVWGFDYNLGLWLLIVPDTYPYLYSPDLGGFLYYSMESMTPNRWFFDYGLGDWVNESDL